MIDEKLVEKFIKKLIDHISEKSSDAAHYGSSNDSCFGMGSWQTEKELGDSIREMFGIKTEKDKEDDFDFDDEDFENDE